MTPSLPHQDSGSDTGLARCPFCGGKAVLRTTEGWSGIGCETDKCPAHLHALMFRTPFDARARWNRRPSPAAEDGSVDKVLGEVRNLAAHGGMYLQERLYGSAQMAFSLIVEAVDKARDARHAAAELVCAAGPKDKHDAAMLWLGQVREDFRGLADEANKLLREHCAERLNADSVAGSLQGKISDERILHLWDTHVAYETGGEGKHLGSRDKIAFARAVLCAAGVPADTRTCTCHPDDNPPKPCPRKFALSECRAAGVPAGAAQSDTTEEKRNGE